MPPVKDGKPPTAPLNTSAQIQQIFSELQSQLPSVNFDNDNDNENDNDDDDDEILETNIPENTDALFESLLNNNNNNSFLTLHPRIETSQQPPSVELQMRVSPNLFDYSSLNQDSPPKPSILSLDLFNNIDFDRLSSFTPNHDVTQSSNVTRSFQRPRPTNHRSSSSQQQTNIKTRDDHQILERLAQQANKFNINEKSSVTKEHHPFKNLDSALYGSHFARHEKRTGVPESQRKTVHIDLRNAEIEKQNKTQRKQQTVNDENPVLQQTQSSDSESDDDRNDGMLWFEKRQQMKRQQQQLDTSK